MSLSQLANKSGVSKGYLWNLESRSDGKRPSAETLYAIAKALGVTISDLLGRELLTTPPTEIDPSLEQFAKEDKLPQADVRMLASIQWRGDPPRTVERWRYIYQAIKLSRELDEQ